MGKRKVYVRTDLSVPEDQHSIDSRGHVFLPPEVIPPARTLVVLEDRNSLKKRNFDFARWYGAGIDPITYACQKQIERFLTAQDAVIEIITVYRYCSSGICSFLDFLILRASALEHKLTLSEIDRELIDSYLVHLAGLGLNSLSQKGHYDSIKAVLLALGRRGLIALVDAGDMATFPRNPFPNMGRKVRGETPLPKAQRQAFATAVKHAVLPIWRDDVPLTGDLLAYALLIVSLHTGRNTTPLLEMGRDCLRAHPKDNSTFLTLWKRRGHSTSKVILRGESTNVRTLEATPTVKTNVERLIRHVITRTDSLRAEITEGLRQRVWLYRSRGNKGWGQVVVLNDFTLMNAIKKLVTNYKLIDSDGLPLRINVSRLRKTFANRIFELLDNDLATTAIALGNTPQVAGESYMLPGESAKRNWRFMGDVLVEELLTRTIGTTYKTPLGRCSDPVNGQYSPKQEGTTCTNFLNCLRCRHYVVTGNDLYKLFSFYFRIFAERIRMDKRRWAREFAHIPRLIDDYIVAEGLRRGAFKVTEVEAARERARYEPHPFWSSDVIPHLEVFV